MPGAGVTEKGALTGVSHPKGLRVHRRPVVSHAFQFPASSTTRTGDFSFDITSGMDYNYGQSMSEGGLRGRSSLHSRGIKGTSSLHSLAGPLTSAHLTARIQATQEKLADYRLQEGRLRRVMLIAGEDSTLGGHGIPAFTICRCSLVGSVHATADAPTPATHC